jgi:argininosuccinate lyase
VFDSADTVSSCLELTAAVVMGAKLNREGIASRLDHGYLDATTLMEYLIGLGVPQRSAHEIIGKLVAKAMKQDVPLAQLPLADFQSAHESLDKWVFDVLGVDKAIAAFKSVGSTAPHMVAEQIKVWKQRLDIK